jgi:cytochrome c oxidase subunit 4
MAEQHDEHAKAHSPTTYLVVGAALMILAFVTYQFGEGKLGSWQLPFSMAIAVIKATLVALFFMHLIEHKGAVRVSLIIAIAFIALLIGFTIGDVATRYPASTPSGAPHGIERGARPRASDAPY